MEKNKIKIRPKEQKKNNTLASEPYMRSIEHTKQYTRETPNNKGK